MAKVNIFCITLNPAHLNLIKKIGYLPVGLGKEKFNTEWYLDKSENNISHKNPYYGEYTFHYWLWKNKKINVDGWIGFCQYRKFWEQPNINFSLEKNNLDKISFNNFNNLILKQVPKEFEDCDSILTEDFYVNQFRFSKFIKHNFIKIVKNPSLLINKSKRNIKFHFDMWHGEGNLDRAIKKLPIKEKSDFEYFVNNEVSFNSQNMFICKNYDLLFSYYDSIFPWLQECEKIFGFNNLETYGLKRIYGFLAERYCSYWFKKYSNYKTLPYMFKDISDFL